MYARIIKTQLPNLSFFLFGPRGTGKTSFLLENFKDAIILDLLKAEIYNKLLANPGLLGSYIPKDYKGWIILDEVQKIPLILDEVHHLMESKKYKFILTGSSARKLKKEGANLLAGRAITFYISPLCAIELGNDYNFQRALSYGLLPTLWDKGKAGLEPKAYLQSYIQTYLKEEVQQEGLTRNLSGFSRFLEIASFSQGEVLNISEVARETSIKRKLAESYFEILEDLLIAYRIPVFSKRAKRKLISHPKFYFFDVGVFRTLRPAGPLDTPANIDGPAIETLVLQELIAHIQQKKLEYKIYYWRTSAKNEVDFILYGNDGLVAIEVKRKRSISGKDLSGLNAFGADYPESKNFILYGGAEILHLDNITALPLENFFADHLARILDSANDKRFQNYS